MIVYEIQSNELHKLQILLQNELDYKLEAVTSIKLMLVLIFCRQSY